MSQSATEQRPRVTSTRSAHDFLGPKVLKDGPSFGMVGLDSKGYVVGQLVLALGELDPGQVVPREVFRAALRMGNAPCAVLAYAVAGEGRKDALVKALRPLVARLRASGEAIGVHLADFLVLKGSWMTNFRTLEGWDR